MASPSDTPGVSRGSRILGAAVGASGALAAAHGAAWSGIGDARFAVVAAIALGAGALIGALTWPPLQHRDAVADAPGVGYAALFGGDAGMLAGAFAGFPLGGVFGAGGGVTGGAGAALVWRVSPARLGAGARGALAAVVGLSAGWLTGLWKAS